MEYSNEVWGTGFPGGQYAQEMGLKMNLTEEGNRWYGEYRTHGYPRIHNQGRQRLASVAPRQLSLA